MQFPMKDLEDAQKQISEANWPDIRLFTVERKASLQPLYDTVGQWVVCTPETASEFSAVGYYFGREIHKKLGTPVGLINSSLGATPAQSWTRKEILLKDSELKNYYEDDLKILANKSKYQREYDDALKDWRKKVDEARAAGTKIPKQPAQPFELLDKNRSSTLYNAMIHPLIPYAIKGVIWYQGETNTWRLGDPNFNESHLYRRLFPAMIQNWRDDWGQGNFPFYYVQLAAYAKKMKKNSKGMPDLTDVQADSTWAELRQSQFNTLSLPNTGMAVTIDIGDAYNIHPKNKLDVGKRLALWALAKDYGYKDIVYSGPLYKKMEIKNGKAKIYFNHIGTGLMVKGDILKGFAICGEDKKFVWANAKIEGDTVLVWSEKIKNPTAVCYNWADWIDGNLYNKENLPASPFRTDALNR
jgi:sialate O-acetylesterase